VTLIVVAVGLSGVSMAGWAVNHLDLAPPHAGMSPFIDMFAFFSLSYCDRDKKRSIYFLPKVKRINPLTPVFDEEVNGVKVKQNTNMFKLQVFKPSATGFCM